MIFWVFLLLFIVSIVTLFVTKKISDEYEKGKSKFNDFVYWHDEPIIWTSGVFAVIGGIATIIMFICVVTAQISADGRKAKYEQTYSALIYKSQTESIRDEFGIVNKEYIDEVQEWNEGLSKYKSYSDNFWIGIFYPKKVYQDLEFIDLEEIKMKEQVH